MSEHLDVRVIKKDGKQYVMLLSKFKDMPKGFISDGASSPRIFWRIVPPFANLEDALGHDWKCHLARKLRSQGLEREALRARKEADKDYGSDTGKSDNKFMGWLAWAGVRTGSGVGAGWKEHGITKEDFR